jgi:hypothetical protein
VKGVACIGGWIWFQVEVDFDIGAFHQGHIQENQGASLAQITNLGVNSSAVS